MDLLISQTSPIQILKDPPKPFPRRWRILTASAPDYYFDNGHFAFIVALDGIYKYDLERQIIAEFYRHFFVIPTAHCFNPSNRTFYIVDGYCNWRTFSLDTKQWNDSFYQYQNELDSDTPTINFKYIPSPIDQLHFTQNYDHYIVSNDIDKQHFAKVGHVQQPQKMCFDPTFDTKFAYNSKDKILMAFQAGRQILLCDVHDREQEKYDWTISMIQL